MKFSSMMESLRIEQLEVEDNQMELKFVLTESHSEVKITLIECRPSLFSRTLKLSRLAKSKWRVTFQDLGSHSTREQKWTFISHNPNSKELLWNKRL